MCPLAVCLVSYMPGVTAAHNTTAQQTPAGLLTYMKIGEDVAIMRKS